MDAQAGTDERIADRQARLLELIAHNTHELHAAYHDLELARHEQRGLRREREQRTVQVFSEKQMGALVGVSEITMARLRKRHRLEHVRAAQSAVMYSTEQARKVIARFTKNQPSAQNH